MQNYKKIQSEKNTILFLSVIFCIVGIISVSIASVTEIYMSSHHFSKFDVSIQKNIESSNDLFFNETYIDVLNQNVEDIDFYSRLIRYGNANLSNSKVNCAMYGLQPQDKIEYITKLNGDRYISKIPYGKCLILNSIAEQYNISQGDAFYIDSVNKIYVEVYLIVNFDGEQFIDQIPFILFDLEYLQNQFDLDNKINLIIGSTQNIEKIYDLINMDNTINNFNVLDAEIYKSIGNEFSIFHPIFYTLQLSQSSVILLITFFTIINVLMIIISIILINGLMSQVFSNLEIIDKRLRYLGLSQKKIMIQHFKKIMHDLLIPIIFGIIILIIYGNYKNILNTQNDFKSYIIISVISFIFALIKFIKPINKDEYIIKKNQDKKISFALIGLIILICVGFIFIEFPLLITSFDAKKLMFIFNTTLIFYIVGILFIILFCIPYIQRGIGILLKKIHTLFYLSRTFGKYKTDKNAITISISLFFMFFMMSAHHLLIQNVSNSIKLEYGGDINIINTSQLEKNFSSNIIENLNKENSEGFTSSIQYTNAETYFRGDHNYDHFNLDIEIFTNGFISGIDCELCSIDNNYSNVVDTSLIQWSAKKLDNPLMEIIQNNKSCIISTQIATKLHFKIGDWIKLNIKLNKFKTYSIQIIGIGTNFPSFNNFDNSNLKQGVLLSQELYQLLTNDMYIDKILIKSLNKELLKSSISQIFTDYQYSIIDVDDLIEYNQNQLIFDYFQLITLFSCIFVIIISMVSLKSTNIYRKSDIVNSLLIGYSKKKIWKDKSIEILLIVGISIIIGYGMNLLAINMIVSSISTYFSIPILMY